MNNENVLKKGMFYLFVFEFIYVVNLFLELFNKIYIYDNEYLGFY